MNSEEEIKPPEPAKQKVALYCESASSDSKSENKKICLLQWAADNKISFDLFEETQSTQKTRPIKEQLMTKLMNGEYQAIIIYQLNSFVRSCSELIRNVAELLNINVAFISLADNLDFHSPSDRSLFQILNSFIEHEKDFVRQRTLEGISRAKQQGARLGRPAGRKDSTPRRRDGYLLREARKKKNQNEKTDMQKDISNYTVPNTEHEFNY